MSAMGRKLGEGEGCEYVGEGAVAEEGDRTPHLAQKGHGPSWHQHTPARTAFFSLRSDQGSHSRNPESWGISALCCHSSKKLRWEGLVRMTQSLLTIQPFPTPGFQFLGY